MRWAKFAAFYLFLIFFYVLPGQVVVVPQQVPRSVAAVINLRVKSDAVKFPLFFDVSHTKSKVSNGRQVGDWFWPPSPTLDCCTCFCANVNVLISASAFLHVSRLKYVALFFRRFSHAVESSSAVLCTH